jgi:DNA-binding transcriptional ArsR family regulator
MPSPETKRDAKRRNTSGDGALAQVRALSHPLRLRLLELFALKARTTMQAAEALGQPPTRLYHHVAALEEAGLVRLRETRAKRGTTEKYYEATPPVILDHGDLRGALKSPAGRRDLSALGVLVFDQARNELIQALAKGLAEPPRTLFAVRGVAHLTPAEAKRMARRLHTVLTSESARRKRGWAAGAPRGERYALTVAMVPLTTAK